jgi:hypothetical protein
MSMQRIATILSEAAPLDGQKNRSSENFKFLALPNPSTSVTGQVSDNTASNQIDASIFHDKGFANDQIVGQISNGQVSITQDLELGANYYIASPANAGGIAFTVTFYGDV